MHLNSETKFCNRLLVHCCTFGISQRYETYAYDVLRMIRRCVGLRNNDG
jgi:hypothetical protein